MSQIAKYSTDSNFGSFHTLYICRTSDLPQIATDLDNLMLSLNRPFDEIFTYIYFTEGTGEYNAMQEANESGLFWRHNISFSIPKDRLEVSRALKRFEGKKVSCLIVQHNENEKKLIGNQKYPLQFVSEIRLGREVTDPNERTIQLTGISPNEAPRFGGYVTDPGEQEALPELDISDLLQRVIALENNVSSFFLQLSSVQNVVNTTLTIFNEQISALTGEFDMLEGVVESLRLTVVQHSSAILQINQSLQYIQSLINQINVGIQAIIDRRRIITVNLIENDWTPVIHNFDLIDQDALTHRIAIAGETVFAPVRSVNNDEIEIYSSQAVTAKVILIALAAITSGKISTQSVDLVANTWVQVTHNFNLADPEGFTIRLAFEEETIYAPVRAVNANTLEIFSSQNATVKAVMIGV